MTLRLRRGLDIDRQSIVFAEGELVYTTDTQQIYVGDGSTVGGVRVTGSSEGSPPQLTQNLSLNGWNISGSGDISATSFTGDGSGLTNLSLGGNLTDDLVLDTNDITGSGNININGTVNALSFAGDGSGLTNVAGSFLDGVEYDISIRGNVVGTDSSVIVDYTNNTFTGNFVGDGSQLSNLPIPSIDYGTYSINIVSGDGSTILVDSTNSIFNGVFIGDGSQLSNLPGLSFVEGQEYQIDVKGNVVGLASTVLVDAFNETIPAEVLSGHANIDISGSIFADDSTLIIDGIIGSIVGPIRSTQTIVATLDQSTASNKGIAFEMFRGSVEIPTEPNNFDRTFISWDCWSDSEDAFVTEAGLFGYHQTGGGGYISITAADSSLVLFNTAIEIDGVLGTILLAASDKINVTAPVVSTKYVQFGSYTTTERNALTPVFGMVIYNTTTNVFEGYQNTSGTTPEWVALS